MSNKEKIYTLRDEVCAMLNDKTHPLKECEKSQLRRWLAGHTECKEKGE